MSRLIPPALLAFFLGILTIGTASATTYYIAANGSDSNSGQSKTSPWLHAPGMTGCSGTCASATPQAGDQFIFRGGDMWHASGSPGGLPWSWSWSGSSGNPIYIGVDQNWFTGSSWARPVFNMDNPLSTSRPSSCVHDDSSLVTLDTHSDTYLTVDNFEFTGKCWGGAAAGAYLYAAGNGDKLSNNYFHGWTYATSSSDDSHAMIHGGLPNGQYMLCTQNVFDGSDSSLGTTGGQASGFAIYNTCSEISFNVFRHVSNGMINEANNVHDNFLEYLYEPQGSQHGNIFETNGGVSATGAFYFYNNIMRHTNEGVGVWAETVNNPFYIFNNVSWHYRENSDGTNGSDGTNCFMVTVNSGSSAADAYFYNNTLDSPCDTRTLGQTETGTPQSVYPVRHFQNSHYIGYSGGISSTYSGSGTVDDLGSEVFQSESAANGQGYTTSDNYAPTSTSGATVGAGANNANFCKGMPNSTAAAACQAGLQGVTYDAVNHVANVGTLVQRSSAWDAGAYEFGSSQAPPAPPTGLAAVVQ